jgi:hypothetical protein
MSEQSAFTSGQSAAQDNVARLLRHLKDGSLAAQLVQAYRVQDRATRTDSMKEILEGRLEQARKHLDGTED